MRSCVRGEARCPGLPCPHWRSFTGSDTDFFAALARSGLRAAAGLLLAFAVLLALPLQAQTLTTLVGNTGETLDTGSTGSIVAQSVRTGPNADGYTISEVVIRLHAGSGSTSTSVSIRKSASGEPGDLVATLTNPSNLSRNSLNTFTAPVGTRLDASKTYWITVSEGISNGAPLSAHILKCADRRAGLEDRQRPSI